LILTILSVFTLLTVSAAPLRAAPQPQAIGQAGSWSDFAGDGIAADAAIVSVDEGQTAQNSIHVSDAGPDTTVTASIGMVTLQSQSGSSGVYFDSGQSLGGPDSRGIAVGDLDGDGDPDAFAVSRYVPHRVWLNDGGTLSDSGQSLGNRTALYSVALGDVDGDGDLDAYVGLYGPNKVWLNDGSGLFSDSGQRLGSAGTVSWDVLLGDLDGDGDQDAFVVNHGGQASRVWRNDGSGGFTDSGQSLSGADGYEVALGDIDGDGDLDALVMNGSGPAKLWLNDGAGTFADSGQVLGNGVSVALGDLDGDGDLDAYVGVYGPNRVLLNDGSGGFTDSGQALGSATSLDLALGDLDGDGDLDAYVGVHGPNKVWLNDGTGSMTDSGQALGSANSWSVALGDVDGDGDLDAFVANRVPTNRLWINRAGPLEQEWLWTYDTSDGPAQSQTVMVTATGDDGASSETTFELVVNNVAPKIDALIGPTDPVDIDAEEVSVSVAFSDPGTADTHTVTWEWGDGTSDTRTTVTSPAAQGHVYGRAGVYVVTVTVVDDDDGSDSATYKDVVIYDPEGGFVTGGGWIASPAGAYAADSTLTGKASFGFVSKYTKGATTPTGNAEFQLKAGDLNFHSSSYDWLVVAGQDTAKFKGTGTINGSGNYGFMVTATDGSPDTFRIKIWDKDAGDRVVYDNQMEVDDGSYDGTAIGRGSIKIHKAK
jgi:hypothetical protein